MREDVRYYKDVDNEKVILVRKRPELFELEYITTDGPTWQKTHKEHPYEREFYLGQGNNCLSQVTLEEAQERMEKHGLELRDPSGKINISLTQGSTAEDISAAIGEFLDKM